MTTTLTNKKARTANTGLAKVAVQCSADTFVDNQSLVLRINICGKIATFAKPENVRRNCTDTTKTEKGSIDNGLQGRWTEGQLITRV